MHTVAITNSKGGVSKTTTSVNLAMGLARAGKRVLLVDLDNNAHASRWLLRDRVSEVGEGGVAEVLRSEQLTERDIVAMATEPRLHVCPSTPLLSRTEMWLVGEMTREKRLQNALRGVRRDFDFVLLDCPPNLGLCTLNALCAADAILCPLTPEFMSLSGLAQMSSALLAAKDKLAAKARLLGYLLTRVDARTSSGEMAREKLEQLRPGLLFKREVRVSVDATHLPDSGRTAWDAGADRRGAEDYPPVMAETLKRLMGVK